MKRQLSSTFFLFSHFLLTAFYHPSLNARDEKRQHTMVPWFMDKKEGGIDRGHGCIHTNAPLNRSAMLSKLICQPSLVTYTAPPNTLQISSPHLRYNTQLDRTCVSNTDCLGSMLVENKVTQYQHIPV